MNTSFPHWLLEFLNCSQWPPDKLEDYLHLLEQAADKDVTAGDSSANSTDIARDRESILWNPAKAILSQD